MKSLATLVLVVLTLILTSCVSGSHKINPRIQGKTETITLTLKNTVNIRGAVDDASMAKAMSDLAALRDKSSDVIYVVVNSPGGSISAGMAFIAYAKSLDNVKTITIEAISMGSAIVEALPGERLAVANATFMFHRAAGGVQGFFDGEIESRLAYYKKVIGELEETNADRIGISLSDYKSKVVREWWAYGKEAVSVGMADRIVNIKCDKEISKAKDVAIEGTIFGPISKEVSKCPLM